MRIKDLNFFSVFAKLFEFFMNVRCLKKGDFIFCLCNILYHIYTNNKHILSSVPLKSVALSDLCCIKIADWKENSKQLQLKVKDPYEVDPGKKQGPRISPYSPFEYSTVHMSGMS